MLPLAGKAQGIFHHAYPCEALRVCKVHICVLWPCRISLTVSTSLRKWRHARPFPVLASTTWPHPHLQPSRTGCPYTQLPTQTGSAATGRRSARDPSVNPAVQAEGVPETLPSIQQYRQLFPSTWALVPAQSLLHYPTPSSQLRQWGRMIDIFWYKSLSLIYYLNYVRSEWVRFEAFFLLLPMNNYTW